MHQFILRKEYFGGILYNRQNFEYYVLNESGYRIIHQLHKNGVRALTLNEDIEEYLSILKVIGVINKNVISVDLIEFLQLL